MPGFQQGQDTPTLNEYRTLLDSEWTRSVACQNECSPPGSCKCQRRIVHVEAMKQWWLRSDQIKLRRILGEMPRPDHRTFPFDSTYFNGTHSCLKIFSLLLKQGRGDLVDRFYESDMNDTYIAIMRADSDQRLRDNLQRIRQSEEVETILQNFHNEQWSFCPLELTLHMDRNLQGTKVIPPFCHKIKMGDKGGTASIYWIAVQKAFISDGPFREAIANSLYNDPEYGECYQMVLKSYSGNKRSVFESEKENFSGLKSNDTVPIVRYLGCYIHDYGEGLSCGPTYNLLLEFGERDLYQAWADETNVPPVQAKEIIRFWQSLFDVTEAIRHIHHFEVPRHENAPLEYVGWHADIKPDNILVIQGRLKFADFGFSRFAPVAKLQDGQVPTELIHGFTAAYGAPEVSHMIRSDGTISGVAQSIDTWSLGCVLSVAATWVVLGFQGVRQFERLRQLSPSNKIDGKTYDRFHDGSTVLPEIREWHNYLRGHVRRSDTTTILVLEVIENGMLQGRPNNRFELKRLCERFTEIIETASSKVTKLEPYSRETDPAVLQALLSIEETAKQERSTVPKVMPLNKSSLPANALSPFDPIQRATMQVKKEQIIQSKPHGRTPFRKEILENELKAKNVLMENLAGTGDSHHGEFTTSPQHTLSFAENSNIHDRPNPESVDASDALKLEKSVRSEQINSDPHHFRLLGNNPADEFAPTSGSKKHIVGPPRMNGLRSRPMRDNISATCETFEHNVETTGTIKTDSNQPFSPLTLTKLSNVSSPQIATTVSPIHSPSDESARSIILQSSSSPSAAGPLQFDNTSSTHHFQQNQWQSNRTPRLFNPYTNQSQKDKPHMYESKNGDHDQIKGSPLSYPKITLSGPSKFETQTLPLKKPYSRDSSTEKQLVTNNHPHDTSGIMKYTPLPASVLDLPYDVCSVRRELDQDSNGGLARIKGLLGREQRKADRGLTKTYGEGREIIFVVDNGATMFEHWPIVIFVAETMAKKAAGLDKSGIDLIFTLDGIAHNKSDLKGDSGRKKFRDALEAAAPDKSDNTEFQTDMYPILSKIAHDWKINGRRSTTLLILTDGIWRNTMKNLVENTILNLAHEATTNTNVGKRPFSIQFIRFGERGKKRLDWLDNELCELRSFRDIVDHCSWRSTVEKFFKGSIDGQHDQDDPEEAPIVYGYKELVNLFRTFNDNAYQDNDHTKPSRHLSSASPTTSIFRTSSRNSNSDDRQRKRESIPVLSRSGSYKSHSRNSSYPAS